jgi:membrane associated rhomboid family serine protease
MPASSMTRKVTASHFRQPRRWSNRILISSLFSIALLTLVPFRFDFSATLPGNRLPLALGSVNKHVGFLAIFLNVLLFVPFGFGIASRLRRNKRSQVATFLLVLGAGALCSYTVEFFQIYVPGRDSTWEDVLTNATGAVVGWLLFAAFGDEALRHSQGGKTQSRTGGHGESLYFF